MRPIDWTALWEDTLWVIIVLAVCGLFASVGLRYHDRWKQRDAEATIERPLDEPIKGRP